MSYQTKVGLKQFRNEGCLSYFFFDPVSRSAALIDPHPQLMEEYRNYISENGLKLLCTLDTHTHADHFSATHLLRGEYGCAIAMSERTSSLRPTRKLRDREKMELGELSLEVLDTPGHTPDSVCYYFSGFSSALVFTGDTLFIGSSGRTDFPGADAKAQWHSIHEVLGKLPGNTVVLPGHDYADLVFSTIETESRKNAHWLIADLEQFIKMKNAEILEGGGDGMKVRIEFNRAANPPMMQEGAGAGMACGVAPADGGRMASINIEKYSHKLEERAPGTTFLDVRETEEFQAAHIPGASNIPISELGLHLKELSSKKRIYVNCLGGGRSSRATKTLTYLGLADVVNVSGGFKAWSQAGLPTEGQQVKK